MTRTAVVHGDQGCVALPKGEDAPFYETVPVTSTLDENAPWPMGDRLPDEPLLDEIDAEKLASAVEAAFDPDAMTLAFVVLHRGRLIAERYREGIDKDTPLESWSMNKSLSATLMGVLIEQGAYTLDQLAPVDSWHEDPDDVRGTIRIQDILRMSSGLRCVNAGDPEYDEAAMGYPDHLYLYTGTVNAHVWATERPPQWPPNTIGRYRNCDPILTNHLVRLAVEKRGENYHQFPQKHLFDRGRRPALRRRGGSLRQLPAERLRLRVRPHLGAARPALPGRRRLADRRASAARGLRGVRQHPGPGVGGRRPAHLWRLLLDQPAPSRRPAALSVVAGERLQHAGRRRAKHDHRAVARDGGRPAWLVRGVVRRACRCGVAERAGAAGGGDSGGAMKRSRPPAGACIDAAFGGSGSEDPRTQCC